MIVIAENINIMSKTIGPAMREKDPKPIQSMAVKLAENGADYLDINIGPARKGGPEMMEFVVKTVQQVVKKPLCLDTMNVEAMEAGLKAHNNQWGAPIINSIMARPERMDALFPLAQKYQSNFIALLYGPEGLPRDANERGELAATLQARTMEAGIPEDRVFYDPVVIPVNSQQQQLLGCTEFMMMLPDMAPESKSTCGLSNVSNGAPENLRDIVNQTYLCILRHYGLKSAILDSLDKRILAIAKDKNPEIDSLIGKVIDREPIDLAKLSKAEVDYVKTARLLQSETLYSDSWLEL
ncbi:MAG: dihydropteroate synthase [Deltaproteobacteria bacterium]|nr:dihydropteroate synthase [Deltaproteobacteria bacterium]